MKKGIASRYEAVRYHLMTINKMIEKRLSRHRITIKTMGSGHKPFANKYRVSYIRKRINPATEEAFWSSRRISTDLMQDIRSVSGSSSQLDRTVKYNDMQIGFEFNDEFEDKVCLCSEWCNWNAFFHFNPIYRFILIQSSQMCITNRTNIPELYLTLSVYQASIACQFVQQKPTHFLIPRYLI